MHLKRTSSQLLSFSKAITLPILVKTHSIEFERQGFIEKENLNDLMKRNILHTIKTTIITSLTNYLKFARKTFMVTACLEETWILGGKR